jgi:hypothetical protein
MALPSDLTPPPGGHPSNVRPLRAPMTAGGSGRVSIVPSCALDDTRLKLSHLRMLLTLGSYADTTTGLVTTSTRTICTRLGLARQHVSRELNDLAELGYLEVIPRFDVRTGAQLSSHHRLLADVALPPESRRTPVTNFVTPPCHENGDTPRTFPVTPPVTNFVTPPVTKNVTPNKNDSGRTTPVERLRRTTGPADAGAAPPPSSAIVDVGPKTDAAPKARRDRTAKPDLPPPPELVVSPGLARWAATNGYDRQTLVSELERCLDWHRVNKKCSADWDASYRTWLRKEIEYAARDNRPLGDHSQSRGRGATDYLASRQPERAAAYRRQGNGAIGNVTGWPGAGWSEEAEAAANDPSWELPQ